MRAYIDLERPPTELEKVSSWRESELVAAGYPLDVAIAFAADPAIDLHTAVGLLANGCPLKLALKIIS